MGDREDIPEHELKMSWLILCADARSMPLGDMIVDAIVTDPPYALTQKKKGGSGAASLNLNSPAGRSRITTGFMGQKWDGELPGIEVWTEALRVLKPGGYLLAFGGTRTFHRLACAIEDAGFEIRDTIMWLYGSGFPKSLDVSKAIDKAAGAEREVVGRRTDRAATPKNDIRNGRLVGVGIPREKIDLSAITAPATDAAKHWQGWGTALKPAWEPIIVARKSLDGTVAENVQRWGTGALNIDDSRIGTGGGCAGAGAGAGARVFGNGLNGTFGQPVPGLGRWPANVVLTHHRECEQVGVKTVKGSGTSKNFHEGYEGDSITGFVRGVSHPGNQHADADGNEQVEDWRCHSDCPVRLLDEQSGELTSGNNPARRSADKHRNVYAGWKGEQCLVHRATDSGGASRFFYTAKADKKDRGEGNDHPTVKPQDLMQYLLKLVARPGTLILDPFAGSGSTVLAGDKMGYRVIGLDNHEEYPWKARQRIIEDAPLLVVWEAQ